MENISPLNVILSDGVMGSVELQEGVNHAIVDNGVGQMKSHGDIVGIICVDGVQRKGIGVAYYKYIGVRFSVIVMITIIQQRRNGAGM